MLSRILKRSQTRSESGFTLIELLVVVIIIGILAAIAIPMYLSQRKKAWHATAESDLRNAAVAMESYFVNSTDGYTSATTALLETEGYNPSTGVTLAITAKSATGYTMTALHDNDALCIYTLDSASGEPVPNAACSA